MESSRWQRGDWEKNQEKKKRMGSSSSSSNNSSTQDDSSLNQDETEIEDKTEVESNLKYERVIVERAVLCGLVEKNTKCPLCGGKVELLEDTLTLATQFRLQCTKKDCAFIDYGTDLAKATVFEGTDKRERSTDYAVNVLFVLANIANGNGATEAARTLGMLGLPRATTMGGYSFTAIEERIAPAIAKLNEEILLQLL